MTAKIDYISSHFSKIQHKQYELYVLSRLWHQLNDDSIHFVFQKCLYRDKDGKKALADLFLPQFMLLVEVDEAYHMSQTDADNKRIKDIINMQKQEIVVRRIKVYESNVDSQIEVLVNEIRLLKQKKVEKGNFFPWTLNNDMYSAVYHKKKGYLSANENDMFASTNESFKVFFPDKNYQKSTAVLSYTPKILLWCPSSRSKAWSNILTDNDDILIEKSISTDTNLEKWFVYNQKNPYRVIFFKEDTEFGQCLSKFLGVYVLDTDVSGINQCVWKRKSKELNVKSVDEAIHDVLNVI